MINLKQTLDFEEVKRALNKSNIEELFRQYAPYINEDGKISKNGINISCGSISMNLIKGLWFRFSDKSKGNLFTLIKKATNCSIAGAFEIVAQHIGISPKYNVPGSKKHFESINENDTESKLNEIVPQDEWIVFEKVPNDVTKFDPTKDLAWLKTHKSKFITSYAYKNKNGELLGYTIRIENIETGKKSVMPLSYAYNKFKAKLGWRFVGFSDSGHKPIYGLEKLKINTNKPILIVEGEKTANEAQKLLPNHLVISWMGGAMAASKVNWNELKGKEVTIWPDNDKLGIEAAENILNSINKVNGSDDLCSIVDTQSMGLPEKWDLADKLPENLKSQLNIKSLVNRKCKVIDKQLTGGESKDYEKF